MLLPSVSTVIQLRERVRAASVRAPAPVLGGPVWGLVRLGSAPVSNLSACSFLLWGALGGCALFSRLYILQGSVGEGAADIEAFNIITNEARRVAQFDVRLPPPLPARLHLPGAPGPAWSTTHADVPPQNRGLERSRAGSDRAAVSCSLGCRFLVFRLVEREPTSPRELASFSSV